MKLLLKSGLVFSMTGNEGPGVMDVLVENGKIAALGVNIDCHEARTVDCTGKTVFPGFIDAHCHIGLFGTAMGERGVDGNENTAACTPELRGIDGLNPFDPEFRRSVEHGVTTVSTGPGSANPICGQFVTMKTYGKTLEAQIMQAPSAMKMAFGENPKSAHNGAFPVTRMGTAAAIREALFKAKRYAADQAAAKRDGKPLPPFDMKLEALLPVVAGTLPVKAHAHRADDILTALRIAKEFDLDMTIEHCSEGHLIVDQLSGARGVIIGPLLGFPHKLEVANKTPAAARIFYEAGITFAIMSDLPATHTWEMLTEAGACVREGLPLLEGVRAVTRSAAEILKIEDRVGSLLPGLDADIAVFEGNPIENMQARCAMTIVDGVMAYDAMRD
jgi:imidazolonepropionase-like amidohydrolase